MDGLVLDSCQPRSGDRMGQCWETASREAVTAGSHERKLMDGLVLETASREAVTGWASVGNRQPRSGESG